MAVHTIDPKVSRDQKFQKSAKGTDDVLSQAAVCAEAVMHYLADRNMQSAESYLDAIVKGFKHNSSKAFYHSLIHSCARVGNPSAALWCAVRMVRVGLQPNLVTFNSLLDSCAKTGDINLATSLWGLMLDVGLEPNSISYNTMINACAKARAPELAQHWMERMFAAGIPACIVSFSTLIAGLARAGDVEKADQWFGRMVEAGVMPDRVFYNSMINACAKAGNPQCAEEWLRRMQTSGISPDDKTYQSLTFGSRKYVDIPNSAEFWIPKMVGGNVPAPAPDSTQCIQQCSQAPDKGTRLDRTIGHSLPLVSGLRNCRESYPGTSGWVGTMPQNGELNSQSLAGFAKQSLPPARARSDMESAKVSEPDCSFPIEHLPAVLQKFPWRIIPSQPVEDYSF